MEPLVVCSLGNFATKLLTGLPDGISRVHGNPREMPGHSGMKLFPVYHPAAALYTPSNLRSWRLISINCPPCLACRKLKLWLRVVM